MIAAIALSAGATPISVSAWGRADDVRDGGVSEWWETHPAGAEHWFTVAPAYGDGPLVFELDVPGEVRTARGSSATLVADGEVLRYAGLAAWDERGCPLAAWMEATPEGLRILVDDGPAVGRVTVDPVLAGAWTVTGAASSQQLGSAVASAGDVDGDGYADVIVGSQFYSGGQSYEGRALVYRGSPGGLSTVAAWAFEADQSSSELGTTVSSAGDVDGDGYDDVIVGARNYDAGQTNEGRAWVFHGSAGGLSVAPSWTAESNQASARFGNAVAGAGDVNGDGFADVIVGANEYDAGATDEGAAFVYLGSAAGLAATPVWTAEGSGAGASLGWQVGPAGDVDADGYDDVAVTSLTFRQARVYLGSATGPAATPAWTRNAPVGGQSFGTSLGHGDVNGDGYGDLVVGAPYSNTGASGGAFVYLGSATGLATTAAWSAPAGHWSVGTSVAAVDWNADGYDDVVVGADDDVDQGVVALYLGSAAGVDVEPTWVAFGEDGDGDLGRSVASAGDVDGDGAPDLVVGIPLAYAPIQHEGRARLYPGCVEGVADADGDGIGDGCDACPGADDFDDADGDFVPDACELCVGADRLGDADADGVCDDLDACEGDDATGNADAHLGDDVCDDLDACWGDDALGDAASDGDCDSEWDGDLDLLWVASAGDVDADGDEDVIGASGDRVWLWLGSPAGLEPLAAWAADHDLGTVVAYSGPLASAGDVNGDGYDDVVIGAGEEDYQLTEDVDDWGRGLAYVYLGSPAGLEPEPAWVSRRRYHDFNADRVAGVGDLDGDGFDDVIVVANEDTYAQPPRAEVYLGSPLGLDQVPDETIVLPAGGFNQNLPSLAAAGDVNGDGHADVVLDEGLWLGDATGLAAAPTWSVVATSYAGVGDVDGDGYPDLVAGDSGYDAGVTNQGAVLQFLGGPAGLAGAPSFTAAGGWANGMLGTGVAGAGDVNADGYADLVAAAYPWDGFEPDEGKLFLFLGSAGGLVAPAAWTVEGNVPTTRLGISLDAADVDGDGRGDVLASGGFGGPGRLWVYSCVDGVDTDADGESDWCDRCPGGDDALDADADGVPNACDLGLTLSAPVQQGQSVTLRAFRALPGEPVEFRVSEGPRDFGPCLPAYGGRCFSLGAPTIVLGTVTANAAGNAQLVAPLPAGAIAGETVTFQAGVVRGAGGADSDFTRTIERVVQP